ncbi:MAG: shikimate kinase AroK [Bradyrhizobium sp.]|uniref:shikimate kinase AroK n=1 Tax=Bradyrhizobium sp. TaxID=376 RepID=UPI003D0DE820
MSQHTRIFLVGPMGAGKTTIGRRLAKSLKRRFIDCDQELERRTGATISLIFDIEGEAGFRQREKRLIDELTQVNDVVLATGGGAVLDPDNRKSLSTRGFTVFLHAGLDELLARTRNDVNRPLLKTEDRATRLQGIVAEREPLYREVSRLTIDTSAHSIGDIVNRIREAIV